VLGAAFDDVLRAAQAGAGWACTQIYEDLAGSVTAYVRRRGAPEPDDVASETFLHVFQSLGTFAGDEAALRAWVFTIARRRMVDATRRWARRPRVISISGASEPTDGRGADEPALEADGLDQLRPHLETLTEMQRDVVLLRVVGGFSAEEVALIVGRSPAAVRQSQRRGLRALASSLAKP
jgi:RNA polymerase sigma factor (sigma-70 family)